MSQLDIKALEANFDGWRNERAPDLKISTAFERYCTELILREADLSDEEVASGLLGGGDDGGIDAIYLFVNRQLIMDETKISSPVMAVKLWIIQAKNHNGFGETAVVKMQSFANDLLDFSKGVSLFTYYNQKVKDSITLFREKYESIIGQPHSFTIAFAYATKSDQEADQKVVNRVANLKNAIKSHVSSAEFEFHYWGAQELTAAFRSPPNRTLLLDITKSLMADDGSFVCLARLDKFAEFLTDENGRLRQYLLEPNVRDYQGERNPVNADIRNTLESTEAKEFWWLNNGITILADKCSIAAGKIEVTAPELVNGLQTSYEVFNYFSSHKGQDLRSILVRVILPPDEQVRRKIIKATNNQTVVSALSLHATEDIHFDIEELFKLYGIFYDRRKGEYRRLKKPISRIVSIKELAQTVMAIVLRRPNDARARPMTILGTKEGYEDIFDRIVNRDLYLVCILLDKQVTAYLATRDDLDTDVRNDIKYYIETSVACELACNPEPSKNDIAALAPIIKVPLSEAILRTNCDAVWDIYKAHGGDDRAAKGSEMRDDLLEKLTVKIGD